MNTEFQENSPGQFEDFRLACGTIKNDLLEPTSPEVELALNHIAFNSLHSVVRKPIGIMCSSQNTPAAEEPVDPQLGQKLELARLAVRVLSALKNEKYDAVKGRLDKVRNAMERFKL